MYVLAVNNSLITWPYSARQLKIDNPQVSFPKTITDELLADFNVFPVEPSVAPAYSNQTQTLQQINPAFNGNAWIEQWEVNELSEEEIQSLLLAESQAIREERTRLLRECDWTQVPDSPANAEAWAIYRQELRDVPLQEGFPWNITWPEAPPLPY